ncbi:MAG TPA: glycosyltransferase family 4 protein [Streptosporangiaceae bacterium]|nr:glycosyltransferase family 4 protein [Streptosporangiaceae bacterium]
MSQPRRPVVAMVSDAIYPYNPGGKELRYHELTRRLADRADVHVYTMRWWQGPRTRVEDSVTFHAISPLLSMYAGTRRSLKEAALFALACLRLITRRFDVLEADHIPYLQIIALRLVATVRRKRFVVTWHEVWGPQAWREYLGRPLGTAAWFTEWLAMRLPDHIIAASAQTAQRLRGVLGEGAQITVAPNGIDLDAVATITPDLAGTDLVVVGRLLNHKRVDMLLAAVALLHRDGLPVTCRVIGDGPERERLHQVARELGIGHAVDFRHDVAEQKDVYALVKSARVFVSPSAREGFGIAVLEALACGLPVVTTSDPDNLAQHLAARSARSVVCDPSAPAVAAAVRIVLARPDAAASLHGVSTDVANPDVANPDVADPDDAWLADYTWDAITDLVAGAFNI